VAWLLALRRLWLAVLLLLMPGWVLANHAWNVSHDQVVERAWLEDPSGQLTLEQVRQLPTQPFTGVLSAGFGHSAIWVRLRIDPQSQPLGKHEPDRSVLRIRPVYLDEVQVFDPSRSEPLLGVVGDHIHPREAELDGLDFAISMDRGTAPRDLWLRLKSSSTRQLHAQVFSFDEWERTSLMQQLVFSVYVALISMFAIWGITAWLFSRERLMVAFGLKQFAALVFSLAALGYLRVFWPASWPAAWLHQLTSAFSVLAVSAALVFHILFTSEFQLRRWVKVWYALALWLQLLKLGLLAAGQTVLALQINMTEVLIYPVLFLLALVSARAWAEPAGPPPLLNRPLVIGIYTLVWLAMLGPALTGLALRAGSETSLYFVQTHGLFTAGLLLIALQYRQRLCVNQQRQTDMALERSRFQAQQERQARQDQERLLEMLTHELKTPLATMNLRLNAQASGGQDIKRAIREMSEVINRCVQSSQLEDKRLIPMPRSCSVADVLRDAVASCPQPERARVLIDGPVWAETDPQLLLVVISNLLDNACKYAEPDSQFEVSLSRPPASGQVSESVLLAIKNLPGTAGRPDPAKLFEKYYRSPQARRQSGTGLGLYLVRHLVQLLGGSIRCEPDEAYVSFLVRIPCHALQSQAIAKVGA
jgi:signal transduction histidine kinase